MFQPVQHRTTKKIQREMQVVAFVTFKVLEALPLWCRNIAPICGFVYSNAILKSFPL